MIFKYEIRALGSLQTGYLMARSETEAMDRILLYFPDSSLLDLSVDWMGSLFSVSRPQNASFTPKSAAVFSERIAIYLESGLDPGRAVELIRNQDPVFRTLSELILTARGSGARFISCLGLAGYPRDFLPILSAAEESGNLAQSFRKVAATLSTLSKLKSDVTKSLFIPALEIVLMIVFLIVAFFFLLPRLAMTFQNFPGAEKPSGLMALSIWLSGHTQASLLGFLAVASFFIFAFSLSSVRSSILKGLRAIKSIDRTIRSYVTYRFLLTFSSLVSSGVPTAEALAKMEEGAHNHDDVEMLGRMRYGLEREAKTFSDVVLTEDRFAEDFADWLSAVESTNAFDDEIRKMEKAYGEIFSSHLSFMQSLVAPAMVVVSGIGAVVMGLTLYQPLLSLITKVMGKMM
uniref:Putative type II secretion system protein F n=1 Tax=Leptospirillum sp. Group II '5-way CG' TaxID=419541 RepID=B6APB0_9BACT|nr:MAG: Putative type II secretion system protein F [Leptospirillum sp. Group II '5-way CG']